MDRLQIPRPQDPQTTAASISLPRPGESRRRTAGFVRTTRTASARSSPRGGNSGSVAEESEERRDRKWEAVALLFLVYEDSQTSAAALCTRGSRTASRRVSREKASPVA